MSGFNLSEWALRHRSFTWYLILALTLAGGIAYTRLGREEDPAFAIKTMVVQTAWPGATIDDTINLVTDPIEKKLEEVPYLDYVKSYTRPGFSVVYVNLKDYTPAGEIPDLWYQVRKKIADMKGTLPQGIQGPVFNDEFGDTFGTVYAFTADGFSYRELKDYAETARAELMRVPDVGKIQFVGIQNEKIYLDFSTRQLAALGIDRDQIVAELQAQNAVAPAGVVQAGDEKVTVRVSGEFTSEESLAAINLRADGKFYRLADLAQVRRGYADPPSPIFRYNGEPAIGMIISMAAGGNVLDVRRGHPRTDASGRSEPAGRHQHSSCRQSVRRRRTFGRRLHQGAEGSGHHRPRRQLHQLRDARRDRGGLLDPAGAGDDLHRHGILRHRAPADLARRPDHSTGPAGGRRHDHRRDDDHQAGGRVQPG